MWYNDERMEALSQPSFQSSLRPSYFLGTYLMAVFLIFIISLVLGIVLAWVFPKEAFTFFQGTLSNLPPIQDISNAQLFFQIFLHNLSIAAGMFLLGIFFGIVPIVIIFLNGATIGLFAFVLVQGMGLKTTLIGLLPHGIFEIPGVLIAAALGMLLGFNVLQHVFGKNAPAFGKTFWYSFRRFVIFVIPLLLVAAFVESYVTQALLGLTTS
ncbi:MAG TPA: stage II sporulation protein M [Candidatus Paceibacterota bacterium]|nr:stage II sporulation protein M [Candidatus Paceibacterota bacterium]